MKKWIMMGILLGCTHSAFALLSPLNQSLDEINAIVSHEEIGKKIPQNQVVVSIQKSGNGYLLRTKELEMLIEIQYLPSNSPGRQRFHLVLHPPVPLKQSMDR